MIAECLRDDGGRGLQDELADRGGPATLRRDADLTQMDLEADRVHRLSGLAAGEGQLRVRSEFMFRAEPAELPGDPSDRRLPAPQDRPPSTRLPSPRGIALRAYLTALFVAQSRNSGTYPSNPLPVNDIDTVS